MLQIQDLSAQPGQIVFGQFRLDDVAIPLILAAGTTEGPTLVMHCAQHRTEFSGTAAVARLLDQLDLQALRGTLVMLPLVDLPAIVSARVRAAYSQQRREMNRFRGQLRANINRIWPGDPKGSWVDRLADALTRQVFTGAAAVLDFHAARLCDAPFAAFLDGHEPSRQLAFAFGLEVVDANDATSLPPGQLHRTIPRHLGVPAILIETSPASHLVTESVVSDMLRGTLNVMKHLGMLDGQPDLPPTQVMFYRPDPVHIFRAEHLGYFCPAKTPGSLVEPGQLVGQVRSPSTFKVLQELRAPAAGGLPSVGPDRSLLVLPGEELATFKPARYVRHNR